MASHAGDVEVLDAGRALGHDNGGRDLKLAGRVSNSLGVVSSTAAHNALPRFGGVQVGHLVVSTTKLEAEYGLLIFAFEKDIAL